MNKQFRNDLILFLCIIFAGVILMLVINYGKSDGDYAEVTLDGKSYGVYRLTDEAEIDIEGLAVLVIKDGQAYLKDSHCPLKECERLGRISMSGEVIACLPQRITVRIVGSNGNDFTI